MQLSSAWRYHFEESVRKHVWMDLVFVRLAVQFRACKHKDRDTGARQRWEDHAAWSHEEQQSWDLRSNQASSDCRNANWKLSYHGN